MAFQTFENDKNNRVQTKRKNLKDEIRSTWLAVRDLILNPHKYVNVINQFNTELAKSLLETRSGLRLQGEPIA